LPAQFASLKIHLENPKPDGPVRVWQRRTIDFFQLA
jgi:hypothetical protein